MSETTYQIVVSNDNEILEISVTGQSTKENADEIAGEVMRVFQMNKPKKVLIDVRDIKGRMGIVDTYYHVRKYPQVYFPEKISVVDSAENKQYNLFHETVAVNIGFNIRFFTGIDEARLWLRQ